jgi:hypothetical protein
VNPIVIPHGDSTVSIDNRLNHLNALRRVCHVITCIPAVNAFREALDVVHKYEREVEESFIVQ